MINRRTIRYYRYLKKTKLLNLLGAKCVDCGFSGHPAALDFDHVDPKTKSFNISVRLMAPMKILVPEALKCEIRCANCHRIKTAVHTLEDQAAELSMRRREQVCKQCGVLFCPIKKSGLAKFCSTKCSTNYNHAFPAYKAKDRERQVSKYWASKYFGKAQHLVHMADVQEWEAAGSPKIYHADGTCATCGSLGVMTGPNQKHCSLCQNEIEKNKNRVRYKIGKAMGKHWKKPFASNLEMTVYSLLAS